ncbi:MAG: hypothetical protein QF902_10770 [Rhodospirillales bacterium]|jgi:hypothetical protein|nr:hypothetical protein [Rhodospirillales bacterium]
MARRTPVFQAIVACLSLTGTAALAQAPPLETRWTAPTPEGRAFLAAPPREVLAETDARPPYAVRLGHLAFRSPAILGGWVGRLGLACETCHTGGAANVQFFVAEVSDRPGNADVTHAFWRGPREDGLANPVNFPSLRGVRWTAPYGRDGRFFDLASFTRNVIVAEFGGAEPEPWLLDALVAYQQALALPPNPNLGPLGKLGADAPAPALRGEASFVRDCARCHLPSAAFADRSSHDVGTGGVFDTPSLLGLAETAPYFHDGRAADLDAAIAHFDGVLELGYDANERADMHAYLAAVGAVERARAPRTLAGDLADIRDFAKLLDEPLAGEDVATADVISAMVRRQLGRIHERFPGSGHAGVRDILVAWSRALDGVIGMARRRDFAPARDALAAWDRTVASGGKTLEAAAAGSFYDPEGRASPP